MNPETLGQTEEKKYFDEFIENYNTATLPDKKYYNIKIWKMKMQVPV